MSRTVVRHCIAAAALFLVVAPARAQQPLGRPLDQDAAECPSVDASDGIPLELRVAGRLLRVQVRDMAEEDVDEEGNGARVQVRLVGCDTGSEGVTEVSGADAGGGASGDVGASAKDSDSPLFRLMHDLRVGLELAPTEDGRCIRARVSFDDRAGTSAAAAAAAGPTSTAETPDEPVGVELCGLPFSLLRGAGRP